MSDADLQKRVEELERQLADLQRRLPAAVSPPPPGVPPLVREEIPPSPFAPPAASPAPSFPPLPATPPAPPAPKPMPPPIPAGNSSILHSSENWLARIGIGLLIIGVCFFLKFSFDCGWISPLVRVLIGGGIALALMGFGELLRVKRGRYAQVLSGGGMAMAYGVLLAAHHLYHLIGPGVTLALLIVVAGVCFVQSLRFNSQVLGVIATAGAYLSPYLLLLRNGTVGNLSVFYGVVILVVYLIYARKGWVGLFFVGLLGAWAGLVIPLHFSSFTDGMLLHGAKAMEYLTSYEMPFVRMLKKTTIDARLASGVLLFIWLGANAATSYRMRATAQRAAAEFFTSALVAPLVTLYFVLQALGMHDRHSFGWLALIFAGISFGISGLAWWRGWKNLVRANAISGTLLVFLVLPALITGHLLFFIGLAVAWAVHYIARKANDPVFRFFGHAATAYVYLRGVVFYLLTAHVGNYFFANPYVLTAILCNFGILFIAAMLPGTFSRHAYRVAAWVGFFIVLFRWADVRDLEWITVAAMLACYGIVLRAIARWRNFSEAHVFGHAAVYGAALIALLHAMTSIHPAMFQLRLEMFSPLAVLALCMISAWFPQPSGLRMTYLILSHVLLLTMIWHEFAGYAPQFVSMTWAVYAIALMIASVRRESPLLKGLGISVLVILLIRLFMVDTAQLDPIWRIVVFMGVGLLLLLGAYFLPKGKPRGSV